MKTTLIMLETLNGYIAKSEEDNLMWGGKADKRNFSKLTKEIGTVIMGSASFEAMNRKPLPDRHNIIMTRSPKKYSDIEQENFEATSETPTEILQRLKEKDIDHVAVTGGAQINALFFDQNLIDEIKITIAPKIFTSGTKLIETSVDIDIDLELIDLKKLDTNTLFIHYKVTK
jgi:dihydrofolate reductase